MFKRIVTIGLMLPVFAVAAASVAQAQRIDNKTVLTFSQPVEIPGHVLPAGTYVFKLLDSMSDRHIVEVFNADQSKIIATVMAIPDYRLDATDKTVITFTETPSGSPEAIRAWFYPGNRTGQEFVYPKKRAVELARSAKAVVPAVEVDVADINALKTAPIIAITADEKEVPVTAAIQTTPIEQTAAKASSPIAMETAARELPKTSSYLPTMVIFGVGALAAAFALFVFGKTAPATLT